MGWGGVGGNFGLLWACNRWARIGCRAHHANCRLEPPPPPVWPPPRRGTHVRGEVLPAKPICATPASARFCRSPLAEAAAPTLVDTAASGVDLEVDVTDDAASRVCEKLRGRAPSEGLSLQGHMAC